MKKPLVTTMISDMKIVPYRDENDNLLMGRVIYSSLCHWMRYIVCSEISEEIGVSKSYLFRRTKELINHFIEIFPEVKEWLGLSNIEKEMEIEELVHIIRERMINSGEIIVDSNNRIVCSPYARRYANCYYDRIVGMCNAELSCMHVGITRISEKSDVEVINDEYISEHSAKEYVNWLYGRSSWNEISNTSEYEFFNPLSSSPPYQSWGNNKNLQQKYHLGRIETFKGMKEYYLLKYKDGQWYNCAMNSRLHEISEERRIVLGLRALYGNPVVAEYEHRNTAVIVYLYCRLPQLIQNRIETYCWPLRNINDTCYVVPFKLWDEISMMLQNELSIVFKEKNYG